MVYIDLCQAYVSEDLNTNLGVYLEIDKITTKELSDRVYQRAISAILRLRQIPVNYMGVYFWKTVDFEVAKAQVVKDEVKFKTPEQYFEYFGELWQQELDKGKPLFEFRVIEDYTETSSLILYRNSHMAFDGMGVSSLFSTITDKQFQTHSKKKTFKPSFIERLKLYFNIISAFLETDKAYNELKTDGQSKMLFSKSNSPLKPVSKFSMSDKSINFNKVKTLCQFYPSMKFNDYILCIYSQSMAQLVKKHGIKGCKTIRCDIPYNMRNLPTGYHDLKLINSFQELAIELPITDSISTSFSSFSNAHKKACDPARNYQMAVFTDIIYQVLPAFICKFMAFDALKNDIMLSNIQFSETPYSINGKQVTKLRLFNNCYTNMSIFLFVITYAGQIHFTTCWDKSLDYHFGELTDLMIQNLQTQIDKFDK
jgi:hypothetical protein